MNQASFSFSIKPLSPHTGAAVLGVDISSPWTGHSEGPGPGLYRPRGARHPGPKTQCPSVPPGDAELRRHFPAAYPRFAVPECPGVHYVSNQDKTEEGKVYIPGEGYHTDHSNYLQPPKATALHAVKFPLTGGDTQFVNMYEAYNAYRSGQAEDRRIEARHVYQSRYSERKLPKLPGQQKKIETGKSVTHPLVRVHPQTAARRSTSIQSGSRRSADSAKQKRLSVARGTARAFDAAQISVPSQVAFRRRRDLGQPVSHAQGKWRLSGRRGALPLPGPGQG